MNDRIFTIDGPTCVSFSGGRTSGYMLRRVLDAHGGQLPIGAVVLFANTGKEREETLVFVEEVSQRWGVEIVWLEYRRPERAIVFEDEPTSRLDEHFAVVDFESASRAGEPFEALIRERRFLPNPVMRFCTQELKIRPMKRYLQSLGWTEWTSLIGVRFDEPRRWKIRGPEPGSEVNTREIPLADAGVTLADVTAFWKAQPFDLGLRPWEGNCDLCFLKGRAKIERIMEDRPDLARWWIAREAEIGLATGKPFDALFRHDRPSYAHLLRNIQAQFRLPLVEPMTDANDRIDCICGD